MMLRHKLLALTLAIAVAGQALAQTSAPLQVISHIYSLVVVDPPTSKHLFVMEPDDCLRGPLKFFDIQGKEAFSLDAGGTFPGGCDISGRK